MRINRPYPTRLVSDNGVVLPMWGQTSGTVSETKVSGCSAVSMLRSVDDAVMDYAPGDPDAVPAPWDDIWGSNKWYPSSTETIK